MDYPKLPTPFKKKWVEALRSGKYKQGQRKLKTEGDAPKYCCLGVAGEIVGVKGMEERGVLQHRRGMKGISKVPSLIVSAKTRKGGPVIDKLITMNDGGLSFKKIATWIEKHL